MVSHQYDHALAVKIDRHTSAVCLSCAERQANDRGYPRLYWVANTPYAVPASSLCICGKRMDHPESLVAAERIGKLIALDTARGKHRGEPQEDAHASD